MRIKLCSSILLLLSSSVALSMEKSASAMPSSDEIETLKQNLAKADLACRKYYGNRDNLYTQKDYLERQLMQAANPSQDPCELDEQIRSDPRIRKLEEEILKASELHEEAFLDKEYWRTKLRDIKPQYFISGRNIFNTRAF